MNQAQKNLNALVAQANTPGLDNANKQFQNLAFYAKLTNPGLSEFPKVPMWDVSRNRDPVPADGAPTQATRLPHPRLRSLARHARARRAASGRRIGYPHNIAAGIRFDFRRFEPVTRHFLPVATLPRLSAPSERLTDSR
ncbi:hypothetical protein [Burkholderia lata]|uniref:hypothetical protein n=1 Tax=Burkholderia lata (strain ATCC 17760 / DSM 23089 / LMG 22485 / NCIMB 9086 / R18194 / 383) TaxID=482957 RepID=UPI0012EABA47|nr:hypothetical protein [Burkholderia lata]